MIFSFADEQLEFPVLYASAKEGWVSQAYTKCTEGEERTVAPLMDAIVEHVAAPHGDLRAPFRMLVNRNPQFILARFNSGYSMFCGLIKADMQVALPVCILSSVFFNFNITVVPISRGKEIYFSLRTSPSGLHLDIKNCGLCTGIYDGA